MRALFVFSHRLVFSSGKVKSLFKNLFYVLLVFILISAVFSVFSNDSKPENIALSQLAQEIKEEKVEKIIVAENKLEIILKEGVAQTARKETEAPLTETLKNYGVTPEELNKINLEVQEASGFGFWAAAILPFLLPLLIIGLFFWFMMRQAQRGSNQAFGFTKSLVKMILPQDKKRQKTTFKDVAGLREAKEELEEVVDFLKHPKKFLAIGAKIPKGVLLVGPPGTGKTLLSRAVAGEAGVPFFHISGSEFVELFVGVGASRVRDTFGLAKKSAPAILFIDELDAIGRHRGAGLGGGHDEREQTLNQILVEMDGFDPNDQVVVLSATNRPDILDPALLRPGRFDRRVILDLPEINDREAILKIHAANKPLVKKVDLRQIAERTPGFSGADLSNLMNEAAILAARKDRQEITMEDLTSSIEKVMLGPERHSSVLLKREKEIAAYHEAGHALVAASLPNTDPIRKISIISRGRAAGYTLKLPTEDKHFHSKTEFVEELSVFLGGYAAEKLVFNEITTGASSDLEKTSDLARNMVTRWGMSENLGPMTFGDREELVFLGREISEQKNYSETVATQIDQEISGFVDRAYKTALEILKTKKTLLEKIAQELLEKEVIERERFEELIKQGK